MSTTQAPASPLIELLRAMTPEEREQFAMLAGTTVSYLYHVAGYHRTPSVVLAFDIQEASQLLHKHSKGRLPFITAEQIAQSIKAAESARVE